MPFTLEPRRLRRLGQILLALLVAIAAVLLWRSGLLNDLSVDALRERAAAAGAWGPPLFVLLFVLGELVHVPSVVFLVAAGLAWPLPLALATAWVGAVAAATAVFSVSRYLLSDWVRDRLPARALQVDARLLDHGVRNVALLRLLTFMMPLMHWVLGVSRVSFRDATLGTALGLLPGVALLVVLGERLTEGWDAARPWLLAGAVAFVALRAVQHLRARRARAA